MAEVDGGPEPLEAGAAYRETMKPDGPRPR